MSQLSNHTNNLFPDIAQEEQVEIATTVMVPDTMSPSVKDDEDVEIDGKIDEVYDVALGSFREQMDMVQMMEPRYAARNAEVAANYLKIALDAAAIRARVKTDRKKTQTFIPFGEVSGNGAVRATREEIFQMLADKNKNDKS